MSASRHTLSVVPSARGYEGQCKCGWRKDGIGVEIIDLWKQHCRDVQVDDSHP